MKKLWVIIGAITCISLGNTVFAEDYPAGLVSLWEFNEAAGTTANDSIGTNDGSIVGATWTTGIINGALGFDGIDDYVAFSEISGSAYDNFTITVWFNTDIDYSNIPPGSNYNEYYGHVFSSGIGTINIYPSEVSGGSGTAGATSFIVFPYRNGWCAAPSCYYGHPNQNAYLLQIVDVIDENKWHHAVLTAEGSNPPKAYLDGTLVGILSDQNIGYSANHNYARVGVNTYDWFGTIYNQSYFSGAVDELAIYNRALTPDEIEQLYLDGIAIPASVDIHPDTLNKKSKGNWITCYVELPPEYDVANIDVSTVTLNKTISAELSPINIADYDNDGILDLMLKFDRTAVQSSTGVGSSDFAIEGSLVDGIIFKGTDQVLVIDKGNEHQNDDDHGSVVY